MTYKTSLFLLNKITFTCNDLFPKKACEATKEMKDLVLNWSHLNLCRQFPFSFK